MRTPEQVRWDFVQQWLDKQMAMKHLQRTVKAIIRPGDESGFVGECVEIAVVTQGTTIDETIHNLREAVALHLEGENPADFGLSERP